MYLQSSCTVWEKWKCSILQIVFHQPAKECPPPFHIPRMDIFVNNQLKHTIKKMNWNAEQCGTTKCKWSQAMSKYKNYAPTPAKKSFIFFHITVIQCPAVTSIHDYISTKAGGGGGMHDSCFKKKKKREEIRIRKKIKKRKDTLHLIKEKILCI